MVLNFKARKCQHLSHTHLQSHHPSFTQTVKEYVLPTLTSELNNKHRKTKQNEKALCTTRYKKHRAFVLTPKFCVYLQSPLNIKFGI